MTEDSESDAVETILMQQCRAICLRCCFSRLDGQISLSQSVNQEAAPISKKQDETSAAMEDIFITGMWKALYRSHKAMSLYRSIP